MNWRHLSLASVALVAGGAFFVGRRASAASSTPAEGQDDVDVDVDLPPMPTPGEVAGDLDTNWGITPVDLRPLFVTMEEVSKIKDSARIFAVIAYRESRFVTSAQNGNGTSEEAERDASRRAYKNNKDRNPPLKFGSQAAEFGSGGLFGALAPYFLWTGVPERGAKAPLLRAPPEIMFQPRAAAFGACVYLQRILAHYRVDDLADIKVGWANPSLLGKDRGSKTYHDVRARFLADAMDMDVDLTSPAMPKTLSASNWPGVPAVFAALVGSLPESIA